MVFFDDLKQEFKTADKENNFRIQKKFKVILRNICLTPMMVISVVGFILFLLEITRIVERIF